MPPRFELRNGSRGKFPRALQDALNARRPIGSAPLTVDGVCGPATLTAASRALGRPAVGPLTREDLARLGVLIRLLSDLSGHNEGGGKRLVSVDKMAHAGVWGNWWKLTEGRAYVNREAKRQADEAGSVMARGGYHFGDPSADRTGLDVAALLDDARIEAEHYLRTRDAVFGGTGPELFDVLDVERGHGAKLTRQLAAFFKPNKARRAEMTIRWCLHWLETVQRSTGRQPWVYTALWAHDAYLRAASPELRQALAQYPVWLASYNSGTEPARVLPAPWGEWRAWQFTGSGAIDGVDGRVDLSWALAEDLA